MTGFIGWGVPIGLPASASGIYGPGFADDSKSNVSIGQSGRMLAMRWVASTTSALDGIRWSQRGHGPSSGYSNGTGGTITVSIQGDNGSGIPNGTSLASATITTGNSTGDWETYTEMTFSSPPTLTAGTTYYAVFTNPDTTNWISSNNAWLYTPEVPRQPYISDAVFGLMYTTTGSWSGVTLDPNYTPVVDLRYANGVHDGQSYYSAMIANYATINGADHMARELFTVTGGNKTVGSVSIRLRRTSGTDPLTLTLETVNVSTGLSTGTVEAVTIPAASIPILTTAGTDAGGGNWATASFTTTHTLTSGSTYNLRVSTASGTTYTTSPCIRDGGDDNSMVSRAFTDGVGQFTTNYSSGPTWTLNYLYNHQNTQFYFTLA